MMITDHYMHLLSVLRTRRKGATAVEVERLLDARGVDLAGLYMRLHRMVHHGWLAKDGVSYEITELGRLAHDYGKAERA